MRILTSTLPSPHHIQFLGNEAWLSQISKDLSPEAPEMSKIHGQVTLRTDSGGFILVSGSVTAQATRHCDRCGQAVSIPLHSDFSATFRPPFTDVAPRILALSSEDLEVYFIEDGAVDLEVIINDSLQCAIPTHIGCSQADVTVCGSGEDSLVLTAEDKLRMDAESAASSSNNPFLALKEQLASSKKVKKT
jgi:uncharacterized metal-binding protein YceD (DUF177 family)